MIEQDTPDAPKPGASRKAVENASPGSPEDEPTCALCGGKIGPDDVVCPHCGESLVAG